MRRILIGLLPLLLVGCALIPRPLQVENDNALLGFPAAIQDLELAKDKPVRWGGVIASVTNLAKETVVEIVEYPLMSTSRPRLSDAGSRGRFRVHISRFLEPQDYKAGHQVTVVGVISGAEQGNIGEYEYLFPRVDAEQLFLWKEEKKTDTTVVYYRPYVYDYWYRPVRIVRKL